MTFISLLFLLSIFLFHTRCTNITIQCVDRDDYYRLMYQICSKQVLCKELYYLDVPHHNNTVIVEQDYQRFRYQMSLIVFYTYSPPPPHWDGVPLVEILFPPVWQPNVTIEFSSSTSPPCKESYDLEDPSNLEFIYLSLYTLQSYKEYISNEHYCADFNERPIYNPATGEFDCFCTNDKLCNNVASYRQLMLYIMLLVLSSVLIYIAENYIITFRTKRNNCC